MTDSGKPCCNLNTAAVYWHIGAHGSQQKGIKGNKTDSSCDEIVVAGKGEVKGKDTLYELTYSACTSGKPA